MIKRILGLWIIVVSGAIAAGIVSCSDDGNSVNETVASCEGCHTDYAYLQTVFSPDTATVSGGCGGDAPHFEPYDRVFMGGDGFEAYKESSHYAIGCKGCHRGVDDTSDKEEAHSGDFVSHPSSIADETCGSCHETIVDNFATSLHNGTGQKRKVSMRSGLSGHEQFDQLPAHQLEGYNNNCATCHGTCGNCHVVRPLSGGGGLSKGHDFTKTPDMQSICVTCHTSRGGHAYLGVAPGTKPDVHLTKAGYTCLDCHDGAELHGDGTMVDHRYAYDKLPECKQCHTEVSGSNSYHTVHADNLACYVCHSQDYNNCGSCHVHGEGVRIPSYMDYKIASNPIPDDRPEHDFVLVRRAPSAPDTWKEYGVAEYSNFDAFPTYNYTSPHNIQLKTSRTEVEEGQSCYSSCHIKNDGGTLMNKELYLFNDDLLEWEKTASQSITVDGKLPSSWMN